MVTYKKEAAVLIGQYEDNCKKKNYTKLDKKRD
jgi:hypothetical protein